MAWLLAALKNEFLAAAFGCWPTTKTGCWLSKIPQKLVSAAKFG
jgi:hypothetical protein